MNKSIYVALIVIALIAIGGYFYPAFNGFAGAASNSGAFTNTPGLYTVTLNPLTSTSTAILNSGATDRDIESSVLYCSAMGSSFTGFSGTALANWILKSSTSTSPTVTAATLANTNYIFNATVSTSSIYLNIASSTIGGGIGDVTRLWPAGTYINFEFNATNTASCTIGVTAFPL